MTKEQKEKIQNSLVFHNSDVWDSVFLIIDESVRAEIEIAIAQSTDESKRSHQCGRVDGVMALKQLLIDTREAALSNAKRK
jgi:hypothetical protein